MIKMTEHINTIIIGGGQAGLSTSYYLSKNNHEHLILDRADKPAYPWRNERWDSFTLVTPHTIFSVPDANINNKVNNGFMPRNDVVKFFENYIERNNLPVSYNTSVSAVEKSDHNGYLVQTNQKTYKANNVVVATGFWQKPKKRLAKDVPPQVKQIFSNEYRNPQSIPDGAVLIIGSGQSGCQIAEELYQNGKKIFLTTGTAIGTPRRYRGKDIVEWLDTIGFFDLTEDQLPPGVTKFSGIPHISGTNGGHELNLHKFYADGVTLLGHLKSIDGNKVYIAPDLYDNLKIVDQGKMQTISMIDGYIKGNGIATPEEEIVEMKDGYEQKIIEELDLQKEGIKTIIWANGYTFDYSFVKLPVFDKDNYPIQKSGVTDYKGLYFAGLPFMPTQRTGFLAGVGVSAKYVSNYILENDKTKNS